MPHQEPTKDRGALKFDREMVSPLRYPGSKRRLVRYIEQTLILNKQRPKLFVELFAGGASVALQLAADNQIESFGLIEIDPMVASFWQTLFYDTNWLVSQVRSIPVTLENWSKFKKTTTRDRRKLALACLFLNRTSFSGILAKGAGPIGGQAQTSKYSLDCRFSRETLIARIEQAATLRSKASFVWNLPWATALPKVKDLDIPRKDANDVFYYVDPPFFEKADRLYRFFFRENDHERLRDTLSIEKSPWLLSYDCPSRARRLYGSSLRGRHIQTIYSVSSGPGPAKAKEIILTNLPRLPSRGTVIFEATRKSALLSQFNRGIEEAVAL